MAKLKINGQVVSIDVDGATPLLWVLREQLGLTGSKYGCGTGICGACTVHINGEAVRACIVLVIWHSTLAVETILLLEEMIGKSSCADFEWNLLK